MAEEASQPIRRFWVSAPLVSLSGILLLPVTSRCCSALQRIPPVTIFSRSQPRHLQYHCAEESLPDLIRLLNLEPLRVFQPCAPELFSNPSFSQLQLSALCEQNNLPPNRRVNLNTRSYLDQIPNSGLIEQRFRTDFIIGNFQQSTPAKILRRDFQPSSTTKNFGRMRIPWLHQVV